MNAPVDLRGSPLQRFEFRIVGIQRAEIVKQNLRFRIRRDFGPRELTAQVPRLVNLHFDGDFLTHVEGARSVRNGYFGEEQFVQSHLFRLGFAAGRPARRCDARLRDFERNRLRGMRLFSGVDFQCGNGVVARLLRNEGVDGCRDIGGAPVDVLHSLAAGLSDPAETGDARQLRPGHGAARVCD